MSENFEHEANSLKRAYQPPRLIVYGLVRELTQAGTANNDETSKPHCDDTPPKNRSAICA